MKKYQIAQFIAIGATALSIIGFIILLAGGNSNIGWMFLTFGLGVGIVSYCFGGLLTALKMALGIAKWGILAGLPTCLVLVPFTAVLSILAFMFLPIIPVRKACMEKCVKMG